MSRWRQRKPANCPHCDMDYDKFRGEKYTYAEVRMLLWVGDSDYSTWKYKRRHTVLGLWHSLKMIDWSEHIYMCSLIKMAQEEAAYEEEMSQKLPEERAELEDIIARYEEESKSSRLADVPF